MNILKPEQHLTYRIDSDDSITAVGDSWAAFANENNGAALAPLLVLGSSLWTWISDPTTREIYERLLKRIREKAGTISFRFRCDGPGVRRLLQLRMSANSGGDVYFHTALVAAQPRTGVSLMESSEARSDAHLTICGWCMRIPDESGRWLEIEAAIDRLQFFEGLPLPRLSHTMCSICFESMSKAMDHPGEGALLGDVTLGALPE